MEDVVSGEKNNLVKMGATGNPNAARLATLQERKKNIEESLAKCNQQLRQLCIQEADLTGTVPQEMPLEPGESPPLIRRRVGTAYQLPENLIKNANATNKDESMSDLELQLQLHANLAEAALGLANEQHISKTLRREHMKEYQQHKKQFNELQEKLSLVKDNKTQQHQPPQQFAPTEHIYKQKKKQPRPVEQDDNISVNASTTSNSTNNDTFVKSELRHSIRSSKCSVLNDSGEMDHQQRYSTVSYPKDGYKDTQQSIVYLDNYSRPTAETLATGVYRLSINGYRNYMERVENLNDIHISPYNSHQHNMLQQYSNTIPQHPQQQHQVHHYHHQQQQQQIPLQNHSNNQLHARAYNAVQQVYSNNNYPSTNPHFNQFQPDYNKYGVINNHQVTTSQSNIQSTKQQQSSPNHHYQQAGSTNNSQQKLQQYYYSHNPHHSPTYRYSTVGAGATTNEQNYQHHVVQNPHQIQPHQQYDHSVMAGLGGYWKKNDNGEAVWCHYNTVDSGWPRDKRFGSLDRRKNKRIHKRVSPSVENKSATLASVPTYTDHVRTASIKSPQVLNRRSQDNRQLIRTQSLGSVGAQTTDSVWPSDDNSSCESDNRSINSTNDGVCKQKKREWLETSLDGPVSPPTPTHSVISRCQSVVPSVLSPEEKYISSPAQHNNLPPSPLTHTPKVSFEIPAESNPSPRISDTSNIELFNNNIPKNCTVVQAGHCKPYHEETKPFEMSDFYKYSTKFNKSPVKQQQQQQHQAGRQPQPDENKNSATVPAGTFHNNLNETSFDEPSTSPQGGVIFQSTRNHSFISSNVSMSPAHIDNSTSSLNSSLDLSHITNANVAEHFSDEMNTWFKDHKFQTDNNTSSTGGPSSKGKSTATLV